MEHISRASSLATLSKEDSNDLKILKINFVTKESQTLFPANKTQTMQTPST